MSQEYTPVEWVDETLDTPGTLINKGRLDQMQTAHHFADGFEEVDAAPISNPGVDYHKVVYCTADSTFYRWDGTQWTKDIDDDTKALLLAHEADHANPHQVTKAQVGLGNVDNKASVSSWQGTPDNDHIPTEKLVKDSLDDKVTIVPVSSGIKFYGQSSGGPAMYQGTSGATTGITSIPLRDSSGRIKTAGPAADTDAANKKYVDDTDSTALHKAGEETVTGKKTILADIDIGATGNAKDVTQVGNLNLTGNLTIKGDITQNGSAYDTHAQQIYTTDDYIIMRDGAMGALASGDYSGFQVKKYDGTNDGRLVIDNAGTARVGDVGDEQPLLTREESGNLTNGQLLQWDASTLKAKGLTPDATPTAGSNKPVTSAGTKTYVDDRTVTAVATYYGLSASDSIEPATGDYSTTYVEPTTSKPYRWEFCRITLSNGSTIESPHKVTSGNIYADVDSKVADVKINNTSVVDASHVANISLKTINGLALTGTGDLGDMVSDITQYFGLSDSDSIEPATALLPTGYTALQYLIGGGSGAVVTDYIFTQGDKIVMQGSLDSGYSSDNTYFGALQSYRIMLNNYQGRFELFTPNGNIPATIATPIDTINEYTVQTGTDTSSFYIDGVLKSSWGTSGGATQISTPVAIFALNNNGTLVQYLHGKVGFFKVYDANGTLIYDYRPCQRTSDSAYGFYDMVHDVFKAASGTLSGGPPLTSIYGETYNEPTATDPYLWSFIRATFADGTYKDTTHHIESTFKDTVGAMLGRIKSRLTCLSIGSLGIYFFKDDGTTAAITPNDQTLSVDGVSFAIKYSVVTSSTLSLGSMRVTTRRIIVTIDSTEYKWDDLFVFED